MDRSRIAVIIPALNESATISQVVRAVAAHGQAIVVDDGSSDTTAAIAEQAGAQVVRHARNQGYDGALNSGFAHADRQGFEYFVTVDADGQHNPALISAFVARLDDGADVVAGVRDRRQRLGEHVFAWVGGVLWGIRDPMCGMKAYRADLYRMLGHFDAYQSIGTELCIFAVRSGKRMDQIPVATADRQDSPRFGRRWVANRRILRALVLGIFRRQVPTASPQEQP
ncbi:MAG: glycosyltransferase family 2 protein [Pseudomonadota bacterium]